MERTIGAADRHLVRPFQGDGVGHTCRLLHPTHLCTQMPLHQPGRHRRTMGTAQREQHRRLHPQRLQLDRLRLPPTPHGDRMATTRAGNGTPGMRHNPFRRDNQPRIQTLQNTTMKKNNIAETIVKMIVAALTAFLTALGTTSCMGH